MLNLVTAPALEPVSIEILKQHLRIDSDAEDDLLATYLEAARMRVEAATRRQLVGATWETVFDQFPLRDRIEIPKAPLRSITTVKYLNEAGTLTTWDAANYLVEAPSGPRCMPGVLSLAEGKSWPTTQPVRGAVTIRFVAGYCAVDATQAVAAAAVPGSLRSAILLTAAALHEQRSDTISGTIIADVPLCARALWWPYRV